MAWLLTLLRCRARCTGCSDLVLTRPVADVAAAYRALLAANASGGGGAIASRQQLQQLVNETLAPAGRWEAAMAARRRLRGMRASSALAATAPGRDAHTRDMRTLARLPPRPRAPQ